MTPEKLDTVIKVSFAAMILGVGYSQFVPDSSGAVALLVWLAGMAGVAVAGFWRARLGREAQRPPGAVSGPAVRVAMPETNRAQRSETLRDVGLIAFLLGLFLLMLVFMSAFVGPPNSDLALTGGALTALGAVALAKRYRFFAVLVACFVVPVGVISAFVVWPPSFWVLLALGIGWLLARGRRRAQTP